MRGDGPESDIVISSRIRLARNLSDFPFIRKCSTKQRTQIAAAVQLAFDRCEIGTEAEYIDVSKLGDLDRQFLMERQLISHELSDAEGTRAVILDPSERFSIMVNEEDHLRLQVMQSGLDLEHGWSRIDKLDDALEAHLQFAFTSKFGYLTACPTNVGTGLRVSVMLHLPALVATKQIEKVFRALGKINVAVRGLFGEGSQFMGDFYQISNQTTLGKSEGELIRRVQEVVQRGPSRPERFGQSGAWDPQDGQKDQQRRDHALFEQGPFRDQSRIDPGADDTDAQQDVYPYATCASAETPRAQAQR